MPHLLTDDGVRLHYQERGQGLPVVFLHEMAGDARSWEPQLCHLAPRYRCIAYDARGYPPSDVPGEPERYSQDRARDDLRAVLDGLGIDRAHLVGLSMGAFAALHFGFTHPERVRSLLIASCGYGAAPAERERFAGEAEALAARIEAVGMAEVARTYAAGPTRLQLQAKDPAAWSEFAGRLAGHSALGTALTVRGVQKRRPSLYDLVVRLRAITAPTLVLAGDEDFPCLEPALLLKREIPTAGLAVLPHSGHTLNLEAPAAFNRLLGDFLHAVDAGTWPRRDPRALAGSVMGVDRG